MRWWLLADILSFGVVKRQAAMLASELSSKHEIRVWAMGGGPLEISLIDGTIRRATPLREFVRLKRVGMASASPIVVDMRVAPMPRRVTDAKRRIFPLQSL